jgi:hypothetical protein
MHYRFLRSLWVLGPALYLAGVHLGTGWLVRVGALGTLIGLFYGYWPRPARSSRRTRQAPLESRMTASLPNGPPRS